MHWATSPALPSAHDLQGVEVLLAQSVADALIADKAFDVHERATDRLKRNGKSVVMTYVLVIFLKVSSRVLSPSLRCSRESISVM